MISKLEKSNEIVPHKKLNGLLRNNKNIESFKRCIKLYVLHSPTKEADSSIKEEGGSVAKGVLKVPEGFGHQEPAEV